ncbi:MAG: DUF4214 domain-containing protein [Clostridia bacterium]|nr:DUF4214 domain-containing protein [Clostridia bacterium]
MKFKRLVASFLMGATLVSGVSMPLILADTNTYASTFSSIDYATASVNMDGIKAFVTRMYKVCLDRAPEEDGLNGWAQKLANKEATGCSVAYGFVFSPEFIGKNPTNEAYVNYMYDAFFGREADSDGFKYWVDLLNNGASKEFVFCGFANSQEFSNLCNNYGVVRGFHIEGEDFNRIALINLFVERLYNVVLNRTCDEVGMPGWTVKLNNHEESGCSVAYGFVFSPEFLNKHTCNDCYVEILYNAFLGRSSDTSGKSSWVSMLNEGKSRELVFNGFAGSPEFAGICSEYGIEPGSLSTEGTTHAEGTCTICGNTNSNGSSNGGATNNGGSTSGNDSSNNGSTNGSSSTGSGSSNSGSNNGSTNNGGTTGNTTNGNTGSTTPTSTPTPIPSLTPPTKIRGFSVEGLLESGLNIFGSTDEEDSPADVYYIGDDGYLVTGWIYMQENDSCLQLIPGSVVIAYRTNLHKNRTYYFDPITGCACKGLTKIDGIFYYFDESQGYLVTSDNDWSKEIKNDDSIYFVDEQGVVQTGWVTTGNAAYKYYVDSTTLQPLTGGWHTIDNKDYYFFDSGNLCIYGIRILDGKYYYFFSDGSHTTDIHPGWNILGGQRYYIISDTEYIYPSWIFSNTYHLHSGDNSYDLNGLVEIGDKKYYFIDCKMQFGWQQIDKQWYYFNEDGSMVTYNWIKDDGSWYYFNKEGIMEQTKWVQWENNWYYLNPNGTMKIGWHKYSDGRYSYLKPNGIACMAEFYEVDGKWYYFDAEGYMATKDVTVDGKTYIISSNGVVSNYK